MKYGLREIKKFTRAILHAEMPLRRRLLVFMLVAVLTMLFGIMSVLFLTGTISVNDEKITKLLDSERHHLSQNITRQFGNVSVQAIMLSENVSAEIEEMLGKKGINTGDIEKHPEVLGEVMSASLFRLLLALDTLDCSGVFIVLDATVNPNLPNASYSRAGLYIREAEPGVAGSLYNKLFLRGPQDLAIRNGMTPQAKWDLEFNIKDKSFYQQPLAAYKKDSSLNLSRLYYWSFESALPDLDDNVLLCSIPLIDSNGKAFGICGFEVSGMHFMLNTDMLVKTNNKAVALFSAADKTGVYLKPALYAGNAASYKSIPGEGKMFFSGMSHDMNLYRMPNEDMLVGFHQNINMYATGSPFSNQSFAVVVAMLKENLDAVLRLKNMHLTAILLLCLTFGIVISMILSRQHMDPILAKFENILREPGVENQKTNIPEIDELVAKIKATYGNNSALLEDIFNDFIKRVATLTPTEMVIFQYYAEGKTFDEIKNLMFIATGTLKTHNTHIYSKLNVPSKDVLMLYIELIKKSGNYQKLFI